MSQVLFINLPTPHAAGREAQWVRVDKVVAFSPARNGGTLVTLEGDTILETAASIDEVEATLARCIGAVYL